MQTLAMFPGQGSQYVGMGQKLLDAFPSTRTVFEEAEDASGINIRRLCLEGPEDELKLTANTQPCLLTVSVATWRVLKEEAGFSTDVFAGHSLGEYSALVAAEKLSLQRAAFLVRRRGEAMQEAVPAGIGAMAAIMKLSIEQLEALCKSCTTATEMVQIANYNSDAQLVVAGHKEAVKRLSDEATKLGSRAVDLPVSAPFHSRLMKPARDAMQPLLTDSPFASNGNRVIANISGEAVQDYGPQYLIEQIDGPVRWIQSMETAKELGLRRFLEVGPGKVLFGLVRRILPRDGFEIMASDDIVETVQALQKAR